MTLLIPIIILILIVIIGIIAIKNFKGKPRNIDYKTLYIVGISWLPLGIVFTIIDLPTGMPFSAMGLVFLSIGLANRDKWQDSKPLTKSQKNLSIVLAIIGVIVFIAVLVLYILNCLD